jgi:uncharacterized membrane protein
MELLKEAVHWTAIVIELMAVVVIAYGSIEAFVVLVRTVFAHVSMEDRRTAWLRFLRFLVVALTFQLAADLVHIAIARGWEDLGRVAAIAVIRTFLAYFLERDLSEANERARA